MRHRGLRPAFAWGLLLLAGRLAAEERLAFATDSVTVTAASALAPLHASFPFTNGGTAPAAITAVESTCDCVSATPPQEACAPGQRGELDVVFDPRGQAGAHEVLLRVRLDSGRVIPLRLRVLLPRGTEVDQSILVWGLGEAAATRTVTVTCHGEKRVLVGARANDANFRVVIRTVEAGATYQLDITPRSTATRALATIQVQVLPEGDVSLYAAVGGELAK